MVKNPESVAPNVWKCAREIVSSLGDPSAMFTSCIRAITAGEIALGDKDPKALKDLVVNSAYFVVSVSPSLKAIFYKAAVALHPNELAAATNLTTRSLLALFHPAEVASILGITCVYRKLKRHCPEDIWLRTSQKLQVHLTVGSVVSQTIQNMNTGYGMLAGSLRFLGLIAMAIRDPKLFNSYWRNLKNSGKLMDIDLERDLWGCSNLEVGSVLAQVLGYGVQAAYGLGFSQLSLNTASMPPKLEEKILCWRASILWTEAFHHTGEPPGPDELSEAMYMDQAEIDKLKGQVKIILVKHKIYDFLDATVLDLSPEAHKVLDISEAQVAKARDGGDIEQEARSNS